MFPPSSVWCLTCVFIPSGVVSDVTQTDACSSLVKKQHADPGTAVALELCSPFISRRSFITSCFNETRLFAVYVMDLIYAACLLSSVEVSRANF